MASKSPNPEEKTTPTPTPRRGLGMKELLPEVLHEILSRLPIHTLLQSRLVSPLWRSLITTKNHFLSTLHYSHSLKNPNPTSLILSSDENLFYIPDFEACQSQNVIKFTNLPPWDKFNIFGSINGFILFTDDTYKVFAVGNPVTGDWINLPNPPSMFPVYERTALFGFGFASKTNQYKFTRMYDGKGKEGTLNVEILTIGTDTVWRQIGTIPNKLESEWLPPHGVFCKGCLHWLSRDKSYLVDGITTFNVENETFGEISVPDSVIGRKNFVQQFRLGVLDGCLMVLDDLDSVWLRKGCDSWSLEFVLPKSNIFRNPMPLGIQKDGNVLLQVEFWDVDGNCVIITSILCSYDTKSKTHKVLELTGMPETFKAAVPHVGTLVTWKDVSDMESLVL